MPARSLRARLNTKLDGASFIQRPNWSPRLKRSVASARLIFFEPQPNWSFPTQQEAESGRLVVAARVLARRLQEQRVAPLRNCLSPMCPKAQPATALLLLERMATNLQSCRSFFDPSRECATPCNQKRL